MAGGLAAWSGVVRCGVAWCGVLRTVLGGVVCGVVGRMTRAAQSAARGQSRPELG